MNELNPTVKTWLTKIIGAKFSAEKHIYSHQDEVYKIVTPAKTYYLKSATSLVAERDNLHKLEPFLNVPTVVGFHATSEDDWLLINELSGKNLAELVGEWSNHKIATTFAEAIRKLHALEVTKIFPDHAALNHVVLHGDMSLPNIIISEQGTIGYIDFGQMAAGPPDLDLADAIWSLQRNIGPAYGELFLESYGPLTMTPKIAAALKFRYQPTA